MCIYILVKESSFDGIVRHISSLASFSFIVELVFYFSEKGKRMMYRLYCLLAHVIYTFQMNQGQLYVRLTSKSKTTRKEAMHSWHFLRDSIS